MPVQPHSFAAGTIAFARLVHGNPLVPRDVEQGFTGHFAFFIDSFELESVEPNPAAAALTHIHRQAADPHFGQFIEASWAFHKSSLPQRDKNIIS